MKKLSTLVLVASLGLAAPAFAYTPAELRGNPFLAKEESAAPVVVKAEAKKAAPAKAAPVAAKKEEKKAAPVAKKGKHKKAAAAPADAK